MSNKVIKDIPYPETVDIHENVPSHVKAHMYFLEVEKEKDVRTLDGLLKTRKWVEATDPENLMQGEYTGVPTPRHTLMTRKADILESIDYQIRIFEKNANPVA